MFEKEFNKIIKCVELHSSHVIKVHQQTFHPFQLITGLTSFGMFKHYHFISHVIIVIKRVDDLF